MLIAVNPKLPMRTKILTKNYYIGLLGFVEVADYGNYLIIKKDSIEIHFFEFKDLDPLSNYGQLYLRTDNIESLYESFLDKNIVILSPLEHKVWGQKEFSVLDTDNNLLTFGESVS